MRNEKVYKLTLTALMAALSYVVFTFLQIKIALPGGDATSLHLGNAVCVLGALLLGGVLICTGIAMHTAITAPTPSISIPRADKRDEAVAVPAKPKGPVFFPVDPNDFNPIGLVKVYRPGTKNGAIISWMDPLTNTEVFRWDENPNYPNGPHYHITSAGSGEHYYPGTIVPEPYATIYFPLR